MDLDRLRNVKQVFFHASCPDGTAAACIIGTAFRAWHMPEFVSIQHGTDAMETIVPGPGQLFVDITPPRSRWEEWISHSPIVLDHHETVKDVVEGLSGIYATNERHSGAMLAFEQVMCPIAYEYPEAGFTSGEHRRWAQFATMAMVRDTWKKDHKLWRDAGAQALALQFHGSKSLLAKIQTEPFNFGGLLELGTLLLENNERKVELIAENAQHEAITDGDRTFKIAYYNCTEKLTSDVGNYLIERGSDVAVGYFYMFDDSRQTLCVSLRSNKDVSVRKIAEAFGGGGHHQAAGFRIPNADSTPPSTLRAYVAQGLKSSRE